MSSDDFLSFDSQEEEEEEAKMNNGEVPFRDWFDLWRNILVVNYRGGWIPSDPSVFVVNWNCCWLFCPGDMPYVGPCMAAVVYCICMVDVADFNWPCVGAAVVVAEAVATDAGVAAADELWTWPAEETSVLAHRKWRRERSFSQWRLFTTVSIRSRIASPTTMYLIW